MTKYVVGFMYDDNRVVLVRKNRPEWQAGLLNGVGGKIEEDESPYEAMTREFGEETGVLYYHWYHLMTLKSGSTTIYFFCCQVFPETIDKVRTMEDEQIVLYPIRHLRYDNDNMVSNLKWILPLALHDEGYNPIIVQEI